jgi:bifunctional pyridoxal-dependent enzyme with beta-cystathionase and maltose regulon repressor activities
MWVADMDFATPEVVLDAIRDRLDKKILGCLQVQLTLQQSHEKIQGVLAEMYNQIVVLSMT